MRATFRTTFLKICLKAVELKYRIAWEMFLISQGCNISKTNCCIFRLKLRVYKLKAPAFAYRSLISTPGPAGTGMEKQRRPCTNWIWSKISTTHMRTQFPHSWVSCWLALSHTHRGIHSSFNWWRPSRSVSILTRAHIWTNKETPFVQKYLPTSAQQFTLVPLS